jgi:RNA polymerase sigma factor (sigma-70 family)
LAIDWQAIVNEHSSSVWKTALRLLGNDADAADCFQETFADALLFSKKHHIKNVRALLLRFAACRSLDIIRQRNKKTSAISFEQLADFDAAAPDCTAAEIENKELGEILIKAFAKLEKDEAEIFYLRHIENLSVSEIAQTFGLKENHISVIIHRTKDKLKSLLQNYCRD